MSVSVATIRSGGQSGADRAALDFAVENNVPYEGWVPKDGWAEDFGSPPGLIDKYPRLKATDSSDPRVRTEWNVRDADATVVFARHVEHNSPGTEYTLRCAERLAKPAIQIDPAGTHALDELVCFLVDLPRSIALNIAGPRESDEPGIYDESLSLLRRLKGESDNVRFATDPTS
jgi:hypothetical protein